MTAERPDVKVGQWITVGILDALVMAVNSDSIAVGYLQNGAKAVKEDVIWDGKQWKFKTSQPDASYLYGPTEAAVKRGPPHLR